MLSIAAWVGVDAIADHLITDPLYVAPPAWLFTKKL
jgi:hypothetical protein